MAGLVPNKEAGFILLVAAFCLLGLQRMIDCTICQLKRLEAGGVCNKQQEKPTTADVLNSSSERRQ